MDDAGACISFPSPFPLILLAFLLAEESDNVEDVFLLQFLVYLAIDNTKPGSTSILIAKHSFGNLEVDWVRSLLKPGANEADVLRPLCFVLFSFILLSQSPSCQQQPFQEAEIACTRPLFRALVVFLRKRASRRCLQESETVPSSARFILCR